MLSAGWMLDERNDIKVRAQTENNPLITVTVAVYQIWLTTQCDQTMSK